MLAVLSFFADEGTPVVIAPGENYTDALSVSSAAAINPRKSLKNILLMGNF